MGRNRKLFSEELCAAIGAAFEMGEPIYYLSGAPVYISDAVARNWDGSFRRKT